MSVSILLHCPERFELLRGGGEPVRSEALARKDVWHLAALYRLRR